MNEQQRIMIEEYMSEVEQLIENIESALPEGTITTEQMAEILQKYSYEESKEEALELCELLLKGVQEGYAYMDTALEQAVEELNEEVPAILEQELEGLSEEEQHQKLLVIYQMLCQQYGKEIDENLAIYLANLSNERLKQDIAVLWEQQGECTFDEVLSLGKERKQSYQLSEKVQSYTSEEQAFVMSTAIFEVLEEKKSNILEPKEVGKQVGMAQRFLEKLKEIANTNILAKGL
ncbi:MAG: hypothetical protein IKJ01_03875, partial [Lachnospiraceae bacterium]|nr:hypothetical protein [Lachnospiraceae bacterium]